MYLIEVEKLNISITPQNCALLFQNIVDLIFTRFYFSMRIPYTWEQQKIAFNHLSDIEFD